MAASILLVSCTVGRRHAAGSLHRLAPGLRTDASSSAIRSSASSWARVLCVVLRQAVHERLPACCAIDTFTHPEARSGVWQSAMTYKFVGAIRGLGNLAGLQAHGAGDRPRHRPLHRDHAQAAGPLGPLPRGSSSGPVGFAWAGCWTRFCFPARMPASFGGFVDLSTSAWFAARRRRSLAPRPQRCGARAPTAHGDALPEDMSTSSLIGGGLIAGESLYTLGAGIVALLSLLR